MTTVPITTDASTSLLPVVFGQDADYTWMAVTCIGFSFIAAYGIGANDVANAFATSVGAKSLTLKQAIVVAAIFELAGVILMGAGVTETVRKGITNGEAFIDEPYVLAFGMMCVCISVAFWLLLATKFHLPVSTTHTAIGSIVGMAITSKGWDAVNWTKVWQVIASWFISPLLSGFIALILYVIVRSVILRSDNPADRTVIAYPILVAFTVGLIAFYTLFKGAKRYKDEVQGLPLWGTLLICLGSALVSGLGIQFLVVPTMKRKLKAVRERESKDEKEIELVDGGKELSEEKQKPTAFTKKPKYDFNEGDENVATEQTAGKVETKKKSWLSKVIPDINEKFEAQASDKVKNMLSQAEVHNDETEQMFTYLQVATCCFDAFAHGANDVANSIGPLAACIGIYQAHQDTGILQVPDEAEVPYWMLALGGAGIIAGLATYGYHIILAIGFNLTKLSPSRGFIIEFSSALVILTGSSFKLPLSTTHCQVGATVGMGLSEGFGNINWLLMGKVFFGWVATVVVSALFTSAIFAYALYSPTLKPM